MSKPLNGVQPIGWAKHLKPWGKRAFWKRHRHVPVVEPEEIGIGLPVGSIVRIKLPKQKKRFGYEWRYKPEAKLYWYNTIGEKLPSNEWRKHWHWYATAKARNTAYKSLCRGYYGLETVQEYRPIER